MKWETHGAARRAGLAALAAGSALGAVSSVHDDMEDEKASEGVIWILVQSVGCQA